MNQWALQRILNPQLLQSKRMFNIRPDLTDFERGRLAGLLKNRERWIELGYTNLELHNNQIRPYCVPEPAIAKQPKPKQDKVVSQPTRKSSRITPSVDYCISPEKKKRAAVPASQAMAATPPTPQPLSQKEIWTAAFRSSTMLATRADTHSDTADWLVKNEYFVTDVPLLEKADVEGFAVRMAEAVDLTEGTSLAYKRALVALQQGSGTLSYRCLGLLTTYCLQLLGLPRVHYFTQYRCLARVLTELRTHSSQT